MTAPATPSTTTGTTTLDSLLDDLAFSYLKKGEGFMVPGAARMRVEAYVQSLAARLQASERAREALVKIGALMAHYRRAPGLQPGCLSLHELLTGIEAALAPHPEDRTNDRR